MTHTLILGDYAHSSWSIRPWLICARFGLPFRTRIIDFSDERGVAAQIGMAPARTVPCMVTDDGVLIWDTLAIAEDLAQRHPDAGLWPSDPALRGLARSLAAEMHSGFADLRDECPVHLRVSYTDFEPSAATRTDLARIDEIWAHALEMSGGPWLCGGYSVADAFYAPVATRIATYRLPVAAQSQAYVDRHLADPALRRWRAMGLVHGAHLPWYDKPNRTGEWPGPAPMPAEAVKTGPAENDTCPYSGEPVTHFGAFQGRVFGFCNAFCRDKTVADAEAWPQFMAMFDPAKPA